MANPESSALSSRTAPARAGTSEVHVTVTRSRDQILHRALASLCDGLLEGIQHRVAAGAAETEVLEEVCASLATLGRKVASGELDLAAVEGQIKSSQTLAERTLARLNSEAVGWVISKWPSSGMDFNGIDKHISNSADLALVAETSEPRTMRNWEQYLYKKVFDEKLRTGLNVTPRGPIYVALQADPNSSSPFVFFSFFCGTPHADRYGRQYPLMAAMKIPENLQDDVFSCIREDPNFILDVYRELFPGAYAKVNLLLNGTIRILYKETAYDLAPFTLKSQDQAAQE